MKRLLIIAGVFGAPVTLVIVAAAVRYMPSDTARRAWKEKSIAQISSFVADSAWVSNELVQIQARGTNNPSESDSWFSERLIVMRNGDWLAS